MSKKRIKIGLLSIFMVMQIFVVGGQARVKADENPIRTNDATMETTTDSTNTSQDATKPTPDTTILPETQTPPAPIMPSKPSEDVGPQAVQSNNYDLEGSLPFVEQSDEGKAFYVGNKIKLYNRIKLHGASDNLVGGYSIITLNKENFMEPNPDNISNSSSLKDVVISSDDTNYYIQFNYEELLSGSEAGIPFEIYFKPMQRYGGSQTITQDIYDADGVLLASAFKEIATTANFLTLYGYNSTKTIDRSNVDANQKIINPVTYSLSSVISRSGVDDTKTDERDIQLDLTIPDNVVMLPKDGWTYDDATRTATYVVQWDEANPTFSLSTVLPDVTTIEGVKINDVSAFKFTATLINDDGTLNTPTKQSVDGSMKYVLPAEYTLKTDIVSIFTDENDSKLSYFQYAQDIDANNYNFREDIRPISSVPTDYTGQFSLTQISMKAHAGGKVFPRGQVRMEMNGTANSELLEASGHNQLIGTTMDDKKVVLAKDIQPDGNYVDFTYAKYKELNIVFDSPLIFTNSNETNGFQVFFKGLVDKTDTDYINYKSEPEQNRMSVYNDLVVTVDNTTVTDSDYQTIGKATGKIEHSNTSLDSGTLYYGHTGILSGVYTISDPKYMKDSTVQNAVVNFVLPNGVALDETALDQIEGLKDVTFTPNMNGSGLNVISGKPLEALKPDVNTTLTYKVPITATKVLRKGSAYSVYSFLSFDNNAGSYDLTSDANKYDYIISGSDSIAIQLGLYKYSHDPNKTVGGTSTFTYAPPTELITTTQVKKDGTNIYVEDTGNTTDAGDLVNYRLNVFNNGLDDISVLDSINVLPRVGDMMQVPDENGNPKERGSKFNVYLDGPVTVPEGFQVQYSSDTPTSDARENVKATWVDTPANYQDVTMIRITMNSDRVLKSTEEVDFDYNAILDSDTSIPDGSKAYNTYATSVNTDKDFMESTYAATSIVYPTVNVNVTKEDADDASIKLAGAEFQLYAYDTDDLLLAGRTFTSNSDGLLSIADLKPGTYYLVETKTPNGYHKNDNEKETNKFVVERKASTDIELTITNGKNEGIPPILPMDEGTVDVTFVDTNGTTIASNTQLHGPDTMAVDFKAPDIGGYTFVKYTWSGVSDKEIFVGDTTQNITAIYQSDTTTPNPDPTTPNPDPTTPGTGIVSTLPYFVTLMTLAGVVLFIGYRKKKSTK